LAAGPLIAQTLRLSSPTLLSTASAKAANQNAPSGRTRRWEPRRRRGHLLLWIPCVIALWAPLYNMTEPTLFGIPFFYWFQLVLIAISALTIYAADLLRKA
jgi:hypothetical protein